MAAVSSPRIRSAAWIPKPAPISAIASIDTAKYWSTMSAREEPRMVPSWSLSPMRPFASRPVRPIERPLKNRPALQPSSAPRWRRSASPSGLVSRRDAVAGPGRGATSPAPSSRRARSANATPTSAGAATSDSASGHQRSPAYGRIACPQPIGESHDSVPSPTSPAARSR